MAVQLFEVMMGALLIAMPIAFYAYVQRLPIAPACPTCRAITREVSRRWSTLQVMPVLSNTFLGECTRCGWRGRMRWRWATRSVRGHDR